MKERGIWPFKSFQLPHINQLRFNVLKRKEYYAINVQISFHNSTDFFLKNSENHGNISKRMRMKIVKMANYMSQGAVAKELGISRCGIAENLSKFQSTGSVSARPRCGRPRKQKYCMLWKLIRTVKAEARNSVSQVTEECNLSNSVFVNTIECNHREPQLKGCIAAKKPALRKKHVKGKFRWSMRFELW